MEPVTNQSGLSQGDNTGTAIDVVVKPTQKKAPVDNFLDDASDVEGKVVNNLPVISQTVTDLLKPGWKTSEWWTKIAVDITALGGGLLPADNSRWVKATSLITVMISTIAYIAYRTSLKGQVVASVSAQSKSDV